MSLFRKFALGFVVLLLVLLGAVAWLFRSRAEEIPAHLAEIDPAVADPQKLVIPGGGGLPDLELAKLKGRTVYLVVEDRESMAARESSPMSRAMAKWTYPPEVVGYLIGDAEGFGFLRGTIEEFVTAMRPELRLPLYVDFQGAAARTFKLPKGHSGLVVLDASGAVAYRHSGKMKPEEIEEVRALLGATLPPLRPAPPFKVGELDNAACAGRVCALAFLSEPLRRSDVPGGAEGFQGDQEAQTKQFARPSVRIASVVLDTDPKLDEDKVSAVLVGELEGTELRRWKKVSTADARAAFEIPEGEAGIVVVDADGKVAFRELGRIQIYKFGLLSELFGVEISDPDEP